MVAGPVDFVRERSREPVDIGVTHVFLNCLGPDAALESLEATPGRDFMCSQ